MAVSETPDIVECCKALNPCDALCMLQDAELNLALGKEISSYKIGEESFTYKKPSLTDLRSLITIYEERCMKCQTGGLSRRRGGGNFRYGERRCPERSCASLGGGC